MPPARNRARGRGCRFVGREGEFHLFSCRTLPLNHRNLVRAFGGKRLLMIGDGHVRNLLSALVAGVRGERFFVDPHGVHEGLHYSFGHKADLWRQVNLASFPGLTPTTSRAGTASPRSASSRIFFTTWTCNHARLLEPVPS